MSKTTAIDNSKLILPITKIIPVLKLIKQYEGEDKTKTLQRLMLAKYPEIGYMGAYKNDQLAKIKEELVKQKITGVRLEAVDIAMMFNDLKKIDVQLKIAENQAKSVPKEKTEYHLDLEIKREDVNLKYTALENELKSLTGSICISDPDLYKLSIGMQEDLEDPTDRLGYLEEISKLIDVNLLELTVLEIDEILASIKSLNPFRLG